MFKFLVVLLAGVGAALILSALTFVSLLIGVLVNAMVTLFAGHLLDARLSSKSSA